MNKNITVLSSVLCGMLIFFSSLTTSAGDFKVKVLTSDGQPLEGVSVKYYTWGWMTLGTTDAFGEVSGSLAEKTYPVQLAYKRTGLTTQMTISEGGDEFVFHTTKVQIKAITYNGAAVAGVNTSFHPSAGLQSLGLTNADGLAQVDLFPGELENFQSSINSSSDAKRDIVVDGDGLSGGVVTPVEVRVVTVNFANKGGVRFYSAGWRSIPQGTNYFMMPGTHRLYFGGGDNISRNVEINPANLKYEKVGSVLVIKDSKGEFHTSSQLRGGYSSPNTWTLSGASLDNIQALEGVGRYIHITDKGTNTSRTYELKVNNTVSVLTQDVLSKNVFNYQSSLLELEVKDCDGNGIAGATARYQTNFDYHWSGGASDSNGKLTMEFFPTTFGFIEVKVGESTSRKLGVVFDGTNRVSWTTTRVKFNYPHAMAYGGANGQVSHFNKDRQLLPGKTKFSFRGPQLGENVVEIDIPEGCLYEKTPVILRLLDSEGSPLEGGEGSFYQNSWKPAERVTVANGHTVALLDGNVAKTSVALSYLGGREQKSNVELSSAKNIVLFQTASVAVTLENEEGEPLDGYELQYYAGKWRSFGAGVVTDGLATFELLPVAYSFGLRLNGSRQQISNHNVGSNPVVSFVAKKVALSFKNAADQGVEGASGTFYAVSWRTIGATGSDGVTPSIYLLPGSEYTFKIKKGAFEESRKVALSGTDYLLIGFVDPTEVAVSSARLASVPREAEISVYPNPSARRIDVTAFSNHAIIEVYANSGRKVHQVATKSGSGSIDISDLPRDIYTVIVRDGRTVRSKRIIKD